MTKTHVIATIVTTYCTRKTFLLLRETIRTHVGIFLQFPAMIRNVTASMADLAKFHDRFACLRCLTYPRLLQHWLFSLIFLRLPSLVRSTPGRTILHIRIRCSILLNSFHRDIAFRGDIVWILQLLLFRMPPIRHHILSGKLWYPPAHNECRHVLARHCILCVNSARTFSEVRSMERLLQ